MGRVLLVVRLAVRDLRRRRTEAVLLLLAVLAATTTLTLGLVLRDAADDPYQSTRAATAGPDVVAGTGSFIGRRTELAELTTAAGVTGHSGPYPVVAGRLTAGGRTADVQVEGRDPAAATVDQPLATRGGWVRAGGVVLEAAFATDLGVDVGDRVTLTGRSFEVAGLAVTAAMPPYPGTSCVVTTGCHNGAADADVPPGLLHNAGLAWLTRDDLGSLGTEPEAVAYVLHLRLADPAAAEAFVAANGGGQAGPMLYLQTWQGIRADATELARDSQILLLIGAWLLGLLAVAGLAVLVGGRMADQTRRVGLLKAVGATPGLVAAVLLAEYLVVAVAAAAGGLAIGVLTAPLLTDPGAGLVGSPGTPPVTTSTVALVTAAALAVAAVASAVPALRGARAATVAALADAARPPGRTGWLIALSARLPVPLLVAARVVARRPRRAVLGVVSVAVTVSGLYVLLVLDAVLGDLAGDGVYTGAQVAVLRQVLVVWTVILLALAAVNAVVVAWGTVLDSRHATALTRALGATPRDVSLALAAAQVLPALAGAVLGAFPGGYLLFAAIMAITGGDGDRATLPTPGQLTGLVLATAVVVAALTAVPARLGGRRPVTGTLRAA